MMSKNNVKSFKPKLYVSLCLQSQISAYCCFFILRREREQLINIQLHLNYTHFILYIIYMKLISIEDVTNFHKFSRAVCVLLSAVAKACENCCIHNNPIAQWRWWWNKIQSASHKCNWIAECITKEPSSTAGAAATRLIFYYFKKR